MREMTRLTERQRQIWYQAGLAFAHASGQPKARDSLQYN